MTAPRFVSERLKLKNPDVNSKQYRTAGEILVERTVERSQYSRAEIGLQIDQRLGVLLSSGFEFPGRYTRWDIGFVDPPIMITARGRNFAINALNARGVVLIAAIGRCLSQVPAIEEIDVKADQVSGRISDVREQFSEEMRTRQPSVFSVLRAIGDLFSAAEDPHLGLYGAFGYDLIFQFEPMPLRLERSADQRDLVLYLPDEILVADHIQDQATIYRYEFTFGDQSTAGLARATRPAPYNQAMLSNSLPCESDHGPGEYAAMVERARAAFARGDLFEAVLGQTFAEACRESPSVVFERLRLANPAPYGALMNLGNGEFLVGASPEMFVRVNNRRIETCPISGTVARGRNALEDSNQVRELLNSEKDEAELTMCTDVDRNDKSRVCEAGSVRVVGRRQVELYSRLIHTVDHVEGILRPEFDALDGFLSHAWAVTVTGAPKPWAIRFIEEQERSSRRWYGGAIGRFTFDGNMNTGLTLRTIRMKDGIAEVRAGATLLFDSDPQAEEAESRLKASALFTALRGSPPTWSADTVSSPARPHTGKKVLIVDHEDSFVHTLSGYFRMLGAEVETLRADFARAALQAGNTPPDLVVLSPGPGRPVDFELDRTLDILTARSIPTFGVCLGLQGIVEYFGGDLDLASTPFHGKSSLVRRLDGRLLLGLPERFLVGRYHSLHARRQTFPADLAITAELEGDGIIMAIEHRTLPIAAVQFHPESIMTDPELVGLPIIDAVMTELCAKK